MRKFTLISSLLLILLFSLTTVSAQEGEDWQIILHNGADNTLIALDETGASTLIDLQLGENTFSGSGDYAFSSDGNLVAVCANQPPMSADAVQTWRFIVRDLQAGTNLVDMPMTDIASCRVGQFSPDNRTIAVGILNYVRFEPNADTTGAEWEIRLYDLAGNVNNRISADEAPADITERLENFPIVPTISQFNEDRLIIVGYPGVGMGIGGALPVFGWSFAENTFITVPEYFGNLNGDYLPQTGEIVIPALDDSLSAGEPMGPVPLANVVRVVDADGNTTTIYQNTVDVILNVKFINDGQAVLVHLLEPFTPDAPSEISASRFVIVGRDGAVTALDREFTSFAQGIAVPGGWALVWAEHDPTQPEPPITHVDDYSSGTPERIYTYTVPAGAERVTVLGIAWASPVIVSGDLQAFTPFAG